MSQLFNSSLNYNAFLMNKKLRKFAQSLVTCLNCPKREQKNSLTSNKFVRSKVSMKTLKIY